MIAKIILISSLITFNLFAQIGSSPYPIIFVHGLSSNDYTWDTTINELNGIWGTYTRNNVYYAVLNAYGGMTNVAGNDGILGNIDDDVIVSFTNETNELPNANLYAINFDNYWNQYDQTLLPYSSEKPVGAESKSNQAAIYKQGYAIKKMIEAVLQATGMEKVILIGHSMGGLAIREYMQRTDNGLPAGAHTWWIDPDILGGHRVAKVITIGTPHRGSNATLLNIWPDINENSEAVRDLRYSYNLGLVIAPYLYTGLESSIPLTGLFPFHNKDVNCNATETDYIDGISYETTFNPNMPLPADVEYTWITSDASGIGGDIVVDIDRQWLYDTNNNPTPNNIADTLLTDRVHTSEPSDKQSIIRGLDEPDVYGLSYILSNGSSTFNRSIKGLITYQTNYTSFDIDYYKIEIPVAGDFSVALSGDNTILEQLVVLDDTQTILAFRTSFPSIINLQLSPGTNYIFVSGTATSDSWQNPYTLAVDFSEGVAPPSPVLLIPADGANNVSQSPTLDWESTAVGDSYSLQVSTDPSFTNLILDENNIHFSDYFLSGLGLNTTYYWRVSATNNWGTSGWSTVYNFTTSAIPNTVIVNGIISNNTLWTSNNLYWVQGGLVGLTINEGVTLEIEPGTIIKFDINDLSNYNRIVIRGNLIADGTPDKKIVFTSIRDDSYGGDTNNDGDGTTPSPSDWGTINIESNSNILIDNAILYYGGNQDGYQNKRSIIYINNSSPTITNCNIGHTIGYSSGAGTGVLISGLTSDVKLIGNQFIDCNGSGVSISSSGITYALIQSNEFMDNNYGITCYTDSASVLDNDFIGNNTPMRIANYKYLNLSGNSAANNYFNGIELNDPGLLTKAFLQNDPGLPYFIRGGQSSFRIREGVTLEIEPGTIIKLNLNDSYHNDIIVEGNLIADGTPAQKIVFTSIRDDSYGGDTNNDGNATAPARGDWGNINLQGGSNALLDNTHISYGGSSGQLLFVANSSTVITNSVINYSSQFGINCWGSGTAPNIEGNNITNNNSYGVYCQVQSNPTINNNVFSNNYAGIYSSSDPGPTITNNSFNDNSSAIFLLTITNATITGNTASNNSTNGIILSNISNVSTNAILYKDNTNMSYVVKNPMTIPAGSSLTIQPGTIIKFDINGTNYYNRLAVQGNLIADGTPDQKIVFTSIRDDSYGGDTNNDGNATTPAQGNWGTISIEEGSNALLDNTYISYGGASDGYSNTQSLINVVNSSPEITNNIIRYSFRYGIRCFGSSSTPNIEGNLITNNILYGIECRDQSNPVINNNAFLRNSSYGIYNSSSTVILNAQQNWWGSSTGPLDNSDDQSVGGWYNPDGLGDRVSDYVDYTNWLTEYNSNELIARTLTPNVGVSSTTTFSQTNFTFIGDVTTTSSVTVSYFNLPPQAGTFPSGIEIASRYFWDVRNSGTTFTNGLVSVPLSALEGVVVPEDLVWLKRTSSGDGWENIGGSISNDNLINTTTFDSFSEFAIGSTTESNPLPIELSSFIAKIKNESVHLSWITATEVKNYGFEIQRSSDTKNTWTKIGFVDGGGNSNSPKEYSFVDKQPVGSSKFLYRLKQIDNDGKYSYSSAVEIKLSLSDFRLFQNFPNPFNPITTIKFSSPSAKRVSIMIYNSIGEEVRELVDKDYEAGYYEIDFNASNLSSGVYFYRIIAGDFIEVKKMLILK